MDKKTRITSSTPRFIRSTLQLVLVGLLGLVISGCSDDPETITTVTVSLDGDQQVQITVTSASATGEFSVIQETGAISGSISVNGISPTAAHIHRGFAGQTGGIVLDLTPDAASADTWNASGTLSSDDVTAFLEGGLYVNVHSATYPAGEIRGQLLTDNLSIILADLNGANQAPAVATSATGKAGLTLDSDTDMVVLHATTSGVSDATAAHIHAGFAGDDGGVVLALEAGTGTDHWTGSGALAAADMEALLAGGLYVNVHTPAFPAGEIRGNLLPDGIDVIMVPLAGNQSVPAVTTDAIGTAGVTINSSNMEIVAHARTVDLATATAAHIHEAFAGSTGGVVIGFTQDALDSQHWILEGTLSAGQLDDLWAGGLYINVHTPTNPGGEIRGQILPPGYEILLTSLSGEQQVPVVTDSNAGGSAGITLNNDTMEATVRVTTSNLTDETAAHIHNGFAGMAGGVVIPLTQDAANSALWTGNGILSATEYADLDAGRLYVNVHTTANPAGEIRGQFVREHITIITAVLSGDQGVPAVTTAATGIAGLTLNTDTMAMEFHATTTGIADATAAHIHDGFAGMTGGVDTGLTQDASDINHWFATGTLTSEQLGELESGAWYVNIHTPANPAGEIRGQLLPDNLSVIWAPLDGNSEVPAVVTAATGRAAVTVNHDTMGIVLHAMTSGLADATAAHIHEAFAGNTGSVAVGLTQDAANAEHWTLSETLSAEHYTALLAGGLYVNVHSPANPPGEIRGQLLPDNLSVIWAPLDGNSEVPAVVTAATGRAAVTVNHDTMGIVLHAMTSGLADATAAHIHEAFAGNTGSVAVGLTQDAANAEHWTLSETLSAEHYTALLAGGLYVNVHSPANPAGEVRGQLLPPDVQVIWTNLSGDNEVPPVVSAASGRAAATVNASTLDFNLHARTTGLADATAAHVHTGAVDATGPVAVALEQDAGDAEHWLVDTVLTAQQYADLLNELLYVNVHSPANPAGDVRGQLVP